MKKVDAKEKAEMEDYIQCIKDLRDCAKRNRKEIEKVRKCFNLRKINPEKYHEHDLYSGQIKYPIRYGKNININKVSISGQLIGIGGDVNETYCLGKTIFNRINSKSYDKFVLFKISGKYSYPLDRFPHDIVKYANTFNKQTTLYFHVTVWRRKGFVPSFVIYINRHRLDLK